MTVNTIKPMKIGDTFTLTDAIEITFNPIGNTVIGSYSTYLQLDKAIASKKHIAFPSGLTVSGNASEILRLADYVLTFGNCLKSLRAWQHACHLANVHSALAKDIIVR